MRIRITVALFGLVAASCTAADPVRTTTTTTTTTTVTTTVATTTTTTPTTTTTQVATASTSPPAPTTTPPPVVSSAGIGDDYYPDLGNPGYDVEHYDLALTYDPGPPWLTATAAITAVAFADLETFNLDFSQLTVDAVRVNGSRAAFVTVAEELVVIPAAPVLAGEHFEVWVDYSGTPGPDRSDALPFAIGWFVGENGDAYVAAEPDAAHTWFPANDHPLDKATFTIAITVPTGVTAAATGALEGRTSNGATTTWLWEMPSPMATYLASVVIGDFDIVVDEAASRAGGVPTRHVLPAGTTVADWPGLERQGEMMAFLTETFGPYPFAEYGIAIVDGFPAALETQTLSLFGRDLATGSNFEDVLVHELAHQWFGNSVSPARWQDIWLNEGFASYAEWLWIERERGAAALDTGIAAERRLWESYGTGTRVGDPQPFQLFAGEVYRVGAMTLHALRLTTGDDAFFAILRSYAARFRNANATTTDFVELAEEISGIELDALFDEWLFSDTVPEFPDV